MPNMTRQTSNAAAALLLACAVPAARAGWVEDLCAQHLYKMQCIATVCANVPGLCRSPQPTTFTGGSHPVFGGSGGSDDRYKMMLPPGHRPPVDQHGWNQSEKQLYERMTKAWGGPAYSGTAMEGFKSQLAVPPAFPGLDTPAPVEFKLDVLRPPNADEATRAVQPSQSRH